MSKIVYGLTLVLDDLDPNFLRLIDKHILDKSRMNHKIPYELNITNMLRQRMEKTLRLDNSGFDLETTMYGDNNLTLEFRYMSTKKSDIKPSKIEKKTKKVLKEIGKELGIYPYGLLEKFYMFFRNYKNRTHQYLKSK
jgi:hypothetical protein